MYLKNRYIGESRRLISNLIKITKIKKLESFLVAMDIDEAIYSLDHNFLTSTLENYGFGKNFVIWLQILLRDQEISY